MDRLKLNNGANRGRAMNEVVTREEAKLRSRDMDRVREAVLRIEKLSRKVEGWSSVEEIRRWREEHS